MKTELHLEIMEGCVGLSGERRRAAVRAAASLFACVLAFPANSSWAGCLDGQLQITDVQLRVTAYTEYEFCMGCNNGDSRNGPGEITFDSGVHCGPPGGTDSSPCATATAQATVNGSGFSLDLVVHIERNYSSTDFFRFALATATVGGTVTGGDLLCTYAGDEKYRIEGDLISAPFNTSGRIGAGGIQDLTINGFSCGAGSSEDPNEQTVHCSLDVTCVPIRPFGPMVWNNPAGGSYGTENNWNPSCPPEQGDFASFGNISSGAAIPISGSGAEADKWVVSGQYQFSGSGQVFASGPANPSLIVANGGLLRLMSGASLDSVNTALSSNPSNESKLEIKGATWTNTDTTVLGKGRLEVIDAGNASTGKLLIGVGDGPAVVRVADGGSSVNVAGELKIGDTHAGTLEIDKGQLVFNSSSSSALVGKDAPGEVRVRGTTGTGAVGVLEVAHDLAVGVRSTGKVTVEGGGQVDVHGKLQINSAGANPRGEVLVDGQNGVADIGVDDETVIGANSIRELMIINGGSLETQRLTIGVGQGADAADVTVRGESASGSPSTLSVEDRAGNSAPVGLAMIGFSRPGQLNIRDGGEANLGGGLRVGAGAQGIVLVSSPQIAAPVSVLNVTGTTEVRDSGMIQLGPSAFMETTGDTRIGVQSSPPGSSITLDNAGILNVHGKLSVGFDSPGVLTALNLSSPQCDTLEVGGSASGATGTIILQGFSVMGVRSNASVGVGAGHGEILLADSGSVLELTGTMTIGNPNGGPGGGAVIVVGGRIEGLGQIVINKNGSLIVTGTVSVPPVDGGGIIRIQPPPPSPNVAAGPAGGSMTVEGNYQLRPGGRQIIEARGANPGEFGEIHASGTATLGGSLEVHFVEGFVPLDPQAFIHARDFVEAAGGITGDYAERIYAFPDAFADFDGDGDKDLRDVAPFQRCFGRSGAGLQPECTRADWDNNGILDGRDVRELAARIDGADGVACHPGESCPFAECDPGLVDNPACGGLDDSDEDCLRGTCTPRGCVSTFEPFGSPCDDHIACTTQSACGFGPTGFGCYAQSDDDLDHSLCPDHEVSDADCVRDVCDRALGCIRGVEPPGSPCDDGIACTTRSVCGSGPDGTGCQAPTSADLNHNLCPDHDVSDADCERDICDAVLGCIRGPEPIHSPCDDEIECTQFSTCEQSESGLKCIPDVEEDEDFDSSLCGNNDDNDADCRRSDCTAEGCIEVNEPDQSPCDDGIDCTDQFCLAGQCISVPNDNNCGEFGGDFDSDCVHIFCTLNGCVPGDEEDGASCDDGLSCTSSDSCVAGQCQGGPSACGDDNDADENCTHQECSETEGCLSSLEPNGSPCDDGFVCTVQDHCVDGVCVTNIPIDPACEDQALCDEDCLKFVCDPEFGCHFEFEPESAPCFDSFCENKGLFSACNEGGFCECKTQPPPDFGCPP